MLENIKKYLLPVTPTIVPQWNQHLEELTIRRKEVKRRFLNFYGADSRALRTLKHVAGSIDLDYLKYCKNDYDAYSNYFRFFGNVADYIFNPTKFGKAYRKLFYHKTHFATTEFIIPNSDIDHIKTLPIGHDWSIWSKVKPVTLWYHDSTEHSLDLLNDQVKFRYEQPNYSVTFIDSIALGMMYWKYLNTPILTEEKTLHNFLHKYVFSKLFEDLEDIYLINRIKNIINGLEDNITNSDVLYGYSGGRELEANKRLAMKITDIKNGNLRPNNLLSSPLLTNNTSILGKLSYSFEYLDIEHLKQYEYCRILRDLPYLDMIIKLHEFRNDSSYYQQLTQELRIYLKRYITNKVWSSIADSTIRYRIETTILDLHERIQK